MTVPGTRQHRTCEQTANLRASIHVVCRVAENPPSISHEIRWHSLSQEQARSRWFRGLDALSRPVHQAYLIISIKICKYNMTAVGARRIVEAR
jgi:hypothetical protein